MRLFFLYTPVKRKRLWPTITVKYLALGDSYTIGQGVEENERWPNQLSAQLESNGIDVQKTQIIAQTGWKTSVDGKLFKFFGRLSFFYSRVV